MSLKSALKRIRELMDGGANEEALKLIEEQLEAGTRDYTLYLFAGVINKNVGKLSAALSHFKSAIDLDAEQPRAWQGAFEILSHPEWTTQHEDFTWRVVEKLIKSSSDPLKLLQYRSWRAKNLAKLKNWTQLLSYVDDVVLGVEIATEVASQLLTTIPSQEMGESDAKELAVALLRMVELTKFADEDETLHRLLTLLHCEVSPTDVSCDWIAVHLEKYPRAGTDEIEQRALSIFSTELLLKAARAPELPAILRKVAQMTANNLTMAAESGACCREGSAKLALFLNLVAEGKLSEANDLTIGEAQYAIEGLRSWPVKGIILYVQWKLCQFHKIKQLLEKDELMNNTTKSSSTTRYNGDQLKMALTEFLYESRYRLAETAQEYRSILEELKPILQSDSGARSPILKRISILCEMDGESMAELSQFTSTTTKLGVEGSWFHYLTAYFHLHITKNPKQAMELAEPVQKSSDCQLRLDATLLSAQCLNQLNKPDKATNVLLAAVKLNPYFPTTFMLLAANLLAMGIQLEKAKQCAERAKLLQPGSERVVRTLMAIYEKLKVDDDTRLNSILSLLNERPHSKWALKRAAILEINLGSNTQATEHLQKLIRMHSPPNDDPPSKQDLEEINELCSLWMLLSEVYRQSGNFQSAVRAVEELLHHRPGNIGARLQLLQLCQGLCHYERAIELGEVLLAEAKQPNSESFPKNLIDSLKLLHLHSLTLLIVEGSKELSTTEILRRLDEAFQLRGNIGISGGSDPSSALVQKCTALLISTLLKFNEPTLQQCLKKWHLTYGGTSPATNPLIATRIDLIKWQLHCLCSILREATHHPDSWAAVAECILLVYQRGGGQTCFDRAIACFKKSILIARCPLKRSSLYTQLGKGYMLGGDALQAQHCLIRAIQLNKHNANAWCLLAILYLQAGRRDEALVAAHNAQKLDSFLMEAWCTQALHAESSAPHEAMDLYRHSIVLSPTPLAVAKYTCHLIERIRTRKPIDTGTMLNFARIKELYYSVEPKGKFLCMLALLAEQFWHLDEARQYITEAESTGEAIDDGENQGRIMIKSGTPSSSTKTQASALLRLQKLYSEPSESLLDKLLGQDQIRELISSMRSGDARRFAFCYDAHLFPILAALAINFDLTFTPAIVSVISSVRPLHKLAEVYPPGLDRAMAEIKQLERRNVEEKLIVRHDHLTEHLHELLARERQTGEEFIAKESGEMRDEVESSN